MSSEKSEQAMTNTEPFVSTYSYLTEEEKKINFVVVSCLVPASLDPSSAEA